MLVENENLKVFLNDSKQTIEIKSLEIKSLI